MPRMAFLKSKKESTNLRELEILFAKISLVSGAKLAHAAVLGGDCRVIPAPRTAQGALLHQELA
jgi:hypothetical protein